MADIAWLVLEAASLRLDADALKYTTRAMIFLSYRRGDGAREAGEDAPPSLGSPAWSVHANPPLPPPAAVPAARANRAAPGHPSLTGRMGAGLLRVTVDNRAAAPATPGELCTEYLELPAPRRSVART